MYQCRIAALETPGHFSLTDCTDINFLKQAPHGQMVWKIDPNYEITVLLGCGVYGSVCRGIHRPTGRTVAIKRIHMAQVCVPQHHPSGS
jgi:serine/threonine protein kinase